MQEIDTSKKESVELQVHYSVPPTACKPITSCRPSLKKLGRSCSGSKRKGVCKVCRIPACNVMCGNSVPVLGVIMLESTGVKQTGVDRQAFFTHASKPPSRWHFSFYCLAVRLTKCCLLRDTAN